MTQLYATIGVLVTLAQMLTAPAAFRPTLAPGDTRPGRAPFERLFAVARQQAPRPTPRTLEAEQDLPGRTTVVCGTVVIPADPSVDPRMVRPVPADTAFTMRAVKPPVCRD